MGEGDADYCHDDKERRSHPDAEPESTTQTVEHLSTIGIAAEGLKALSQSHDSREDEHRDATHDGHSRNGCIAIGGSSYIEHHRCHTTHSHS